MNNGCTYDEETMRWIKDPHQKSRPPKIIDEKELEGKEWKDWNLSLNEIEISESMFPKTKDMESEETSQMARKKFNSSSFIICCGFTHITLLFLFILAVVLVPGGYVIMGYGTEFITSDVSTVIGILMTVFGALTPQLCFVIVVVAIIAFVIIEFLMCIGNIFNKKLQISEIDTLTKVKKYLKLLSSNNALEGGDLYVECYHIETKTINKKRYLTRVPTKTLTIPISYSISDSTFVPDFSTINSSKIQLTTSFKPILDQDTMRQREHYLEQIKRKYQNVDKRIELYYVPFQVRGLLSPFKFEKKGFGIVNSILRSPCGSSIGILLTLSCCIFQLSHYYFSGFFEVKVEISKNIKLKKQLINLEDVFNELGNTNQHNQGNIFHQNTIESKNQVNPNLPIFEEKPISYGEMMSQDKIIINNGVMY